MLKAKCHFVISTTNLDSKRDNMLQQAFHSPFFTGIHVRGVHTEESTIDQFNPQIWLIPSDDFQNILCAKVHYPVTDWLELHQGNTLRSCYYIQKLSRWLSVQL